MKKIEKYWEGVSEEVFSNTPEQRAADYIRIPGKFIEDRLKEWSNEINYRGTNLNYICDRIYNEKHEFDDILMSKVTQQDVGSIYVPWDFIEKKFREFCKEVGYSSENIEEMSVWFFRWEDFRKFFAEKLNEGNITALKIVHLCLFGYDWTIRQIPAYCGYRIDLLINDGSPCVRRVLAEHGYGLDILINDKNCGVRRKVADQGYGLDELINDGAAVVRKAVAKQGYGLDKLFNDENIEVKCEAIRQGYKDEEFTEAFRDWARRAWMDDSIKIAVAESGCGLGFLIDDESVQAREAVAKQGYGLDVLINDEDASVRAAVALQGYGLDKLINDEDEWVSNRAKKCNCNFDEFWGDYITYEDIRNECEKLRTLMNDDDAQNIAKAARGGYGLNVLINDKDASVRYEVARRGYGLDILIDDEDEAVSQKAMQESYSISDII